MTTPLPLSLEVLNHPMVEVVKHYEGLFLKAYKCPADKWTIGYGHLCSANHPPITRAQADAYLRQDLTIAVNAVLRQAPCVLEQPIQRLAALMSWAFNLGEGNLQSSTMLKRIKEKRWEDAAKEMLRWNKATGADGIKRTLKGLVVRRQCEAHMFLTGEVKIF